MPIEKITFTGHSGETLAARLDRPAGPPRATALFAHCFTCTKDIAAAARISRKLAELGVAVLRFDFTGLGHSEGEFANTNFSTNVADLVLAARCLGDLIAPPSLLVGHSLGGAAVIRAAADLPSVRAVATLGAPADPAHVIHNFGCALEDIETNGQAEVSLAGRPFTITKDFVDDVNAVSMNETLASFKKALLVLHSPIDTTVGIENAAEIFAAAKHPKSFVTLDQADHLIPKRADADYAASVIATWADRYLPITPERPKVGDNAVRATELDAEGFLHAIETDVIQTLADEPKSYGGTDAGLSPFELVSAGLAACTSMTLRMYARRKGWPVEGISVDVYHQKVHAEACENCETKDGKVDEFRRVITLAGDLDADQRARMLEIADKCPVHRTLHAEVSIVTEIT